jgi:small-conductance mechanosensitive channel
MLPNFLVAVLTLIAFVMLAKFVRKLGQRLLIKTLQGREVFIPNSTILQNAIINYSTVGKRRIDLAVGVSYGEKLREVKELVLNTIEHLERVIDHEKAILPIRGLAKARLTLK